MKRAQKQAEFRHKYEDQGHFINHGEEKEMAEHPEHLELDKAFDIAHHSYTLVKPRLEDFKLHFEGPQNQTEEEDGIPQAYYYYYLNDDEVPKEVSKDVTKPKAKKEKKKTMTEKVEKAEKVEKVEKVEKEDKAEETEKKMEEVEKKMEEVVKKMEEVEKKMEEVE